MEGEFSYLIYSNCNEQLFQTLVANSHTSTDSSMRKASCSYKNTCLTHCSEAQWTKQITVTFELHLPCNHGFSDCSSPTLIKSLTPLSVPPKYFLKSLSFSNKTPNLSFLLWTYQARCWPFHIYPNAILFFVNAQIKSGLLEILLYIFLKCGHYLIPDKRFKQPYLG